MTLVFLDGGYVPPSPPVSGIAEYRFEVSVNADNADLVVAHLWCDREGKSPGLLTGAGQGRKRPSPAATRMFARRAGNPPPAGDKAATADDAPAP